MAFLAEKKFGIQETERFWQVRDDETKMSCAITARNVLQNRHY